MTEKEFINKIRKFREIRPSQDWVVLNKKRIFGQENRVIMRQYEERTETGGKRIRERPFIMRQYFRKYFGELKVVFHVFNNKFAFASVLSLAILFGLFGFAQNSLPGDFLFPLKKAAESSQSMFVAKKDQSNYDFEMAEKRLNDLIKVAQKNAVKNLAPAINEYQSNVSKMADNLVKEKDKKKVKEMVLKITELQNKESKVKSYGVQIGENKDLERAYAQKIVETLEPLIKDLKNRDLTEKQENILKQAEKYLANKNYEQALIKLLLINTSVD